jgi:flavin reductase (DIM6/NTAB) family NADH-FMN oxidoreductase RutF
MAKVEVKPYPAVFPVPVALLSAYEPETRKPNIITLAWVGNVCSEPPCLSVSIRPSRYSHHIVLEKREFCLNIPRADQLEVVDYCGVVSGRDHDKFAETGLTPVRASTVNAPYIAECPVNIECRLIREPISLGTHDVFIAEIVAVHIEEEYLAANARRPAYERIVPLTYCPEQYFSLGEKLEPYGWTKGKLGGR